MTDRIETEALRARKSDLISREAAIDVAKQHCPSPAGGPFSHTNTARVVAKDIEAAIRALPAAEALEHREAAARAEPVVKVKPLVWDDFSEGGSLKNGVTGRRILTRCSGAGLNYSLERVEIPDGDWWHMPNEGKPGDYFIARGLSTIAGPFPTDLDAKRWAQEDLVTRISSEVEVLPATPAQTVMQEPVAWQSRARQCMEGDCTEWSAWRDGKAPQPIPIYWEVEERPLYAHPATPAPLEASRGEVTRRIYEPYPGAFDPILGPDDHDVGAAPAPVEASMALESEEMPYRIFTDTSRVWLDDDDGGSLFAYVREGAAVATPAPVEGNALSNAARDVVAERQRQITVEGWSGNRDDAYQAGDLGNAAACYAMTDPVMDPDRPAPVDWPWAASWWKPTDRRRDLVKAGALILAEIERLDRATAHKGEA